MAGSNTVLILTFSLCVGFVCASILTGDTCVIDLRCEECVPDHMPLVTSHAAEDGVLTLEEGARVTLSCGAARLLTEPTRAMLEAVCERGKYRLLHDGSLRHLFELGCQEDVFEDVQHQFHDCGAPHSGRAYQTSGGGRARHLVALCYDTERGITLRARTSTVPALPLPAHRHQHVPLSILGNFNQMLDSNTRRDAEILFSDDSVMTRRLDRLLYHHEHNFAGQTLTSARLLDPRYFADQDMRVANFISNKVPVWSSVAKGNWANLQKDVSDLLKASRNSTTLEIFAGTHGVASLRSVPPVELYLKPERRFPVPKYLWTVVQSAARGEAVALVTLNDPFVAVSEIRDAVFCESMCGQVPWLHTLQRSRNYETPLMGLVFCCSLRDFARVVTEMPRELMDEATYAADKVLAQLL